MSLATLTDEMFALEETQQFGSPLMGMELRFELENSVELVRPLIRGLTSQMRSLDLLGEDMLPRVGLALNEALVNAMHHGNLELSSELRQEDDSLYYDLAEARRLMWPYCDRRVHVLASLSRERVKFVIKDEGPGFTPDAVKDPTTDDNRFRLSGRGLLMIRSFMDEVFHNDQGNCITLIKYTSSGHEMLARLNEMREMDELTVSPDVLLFDFVTA